MAMAVTMAKKTMPVASTMPTMPTMPTVTAMASRESLARDGQ
jgi:hypothetical protein